MRQTPPLPLPISGPAATDVAGAAPSSAGARPTPPGASGAGPGSGRAPEWRRRR